MNEIIISYENSVPKKLSFKSGPIFSKQITKTNIISKYFRKRINSKYQRNEKECILVPLSEFNQLNNNLIKFELPFILYDENHNIEEEGKLFILDINDYSVVFDKDSGFIAITKTININIE